MHRFAADAAAFRGVAYGAGAASVEPSRRRLNISEFDEFDISRSRRTVLSLLHTISRVRNRPRSGGGCGLEPEDTRNHTTQEPGVCGGVKASVQVLKSATAGFADLLIRDERRRTGISPLAAAGAA
jgi:hypothetical protein